MTQQRCPKCYPRICECRELEQCTHDGIECDWCNELFDADKDMSGNPMFHMCPDCAEIKEMPIE